MEEQMIITSLADQEKFDSYSKEQIYLAYLTEYQERIKANKEVNRLQRLLAEIRFKAGDK